MNACAIDVHHHYVPESLLQEAKKNGRHLGVELIEKEGQKSLSFAGGPPFVLHPELPAVDERLKMMEDSKLAMAALEAHTATLGYRLTGEQGENWCNVYNEGIAELVKRYPSRFVGMASVPLQDPARAAKVLERAVRDLNLRGGYIGTNVNGIQVDLTWDDTSNNEVKFRIEWRDVHSGSGYAWLTEPAANAEAYSHTGLVPLTTVQYRIRSEGTGGCASDWVYSAEIPLIPPDQALRTDGVNRYAAAEGASAVSGSAPGRGAVARRARPTVATSSTPSPARRRSA